MSNLSAAESQFVVSITCFQRGGTLCIRHINHTKRRAQRGSAPVLLFLAISSLIALLEKLRDHIVRGAKCSVELIILHCLGQEQEMN